VANYSLEPLNIDEKKVKQMYLDVVKSAHTVFNGKHPCKSYTFLIHHLPGIGGGLEHLNGTTCQTNPEVYENEDRLKDFFGLIAHEYFHLWNVKRLRPVALGPFDYENENYTNMLWVAEGFTAFYQEDILRRADILDKEAYLITLSKDINNIENTVGNKIQSVAEASLDAWIKYYRPNENSQNTSISYYTKGAVIAGVLNAMIIDNTKGEKNLDDVLQYLYNELYIKKNVGFTDDEFLKACELISGLDLKAFFKEHIYGTKTIDYVSIYNKVGIKIEVDKSSSLKPSLGFAVRGSAVSRVDKGGSAYLAGLNTGDILKSVDSRDFSSLEKMLKGAKIGDELELSVIRNTYPVNLKLKLEGGKGISYVMSIKSDMDELVRTKFNKFFHIK
jgi:predicted metalloprotease with PDZ domain